MGAGNRVTSPSDEYLSCACLLYTSTEPIEPAVADSEEPVKAEDAACVEPEVEVVEASDPAEEESVEQVEPAAETEPIEPAVADSDEADKPEDATPDEQATDGAPERETFVKQDDQELPTAETGNTGTANMVFAGRPAPVSYTHLDVYKRQVQGHPKNRD